MVGSALVRRLANESCEIVTADRHAVDLTRQSDTEAFMQDRKPDVVVIAAAKVGGIAANSSLPVEFLADNLAIGLNLISSAHKAGVRKLLFLGSSCIYPSHAPQPMSEDMLLTGPLEPTNEWYAVAKIAGIKLCQAYRTEYGADFISAMPTNLYGPGDNYHPDHSHVPAALIRRMHEAKLAGAPTVTIWGTGKPRREFLFVDDSLMPVCSCSRIIRCGLPECRDRRGPLDRGICPRWSPTPSASRAGSPSTPRDLTARQQKLLDVSKLAALGWRARTSLRTGLAAAYADFLADGGRRMHGS